MSEVQEAVQPVLQKNKKDKKGVQTGIQFIAARLAEPSTMAGLAALAGAFGANTNNPAFHGGIMAVTALAGIASIMMKERGKSK